MYRRPVVTIASESFHVPEKSIDSPRDMAYLRRMKTKSYAPGALILAMLASSGISYADEAAQAGALENSEIQLKNGETKRGTLVSIEPGKKVVVIIAGEQNVIPWEDVAKITAGPKESSPGTPPAPQTPAPTTTNTPSGPTKGMPFIHVESNWEEVELQRVDGEIGASVYSTKNQIGPQTVSKYICEAPCDKLVDGREGHRFFFSGPGMLPSQQFRLEQRDGYITARVHGMGLGRMVGGVLLTTFGGTFALSGTMLFGLSFMSTKPTATNPDPDQSAGEMRTAGLIIGGIGTGMLVGGILLVAGGRTRVELLKTDRGETALAWDRGAFRF